MEYDVIVLGGGPAGSLTASIIRRDNPGRRVLVLEKERFPRHHVGESTIPSWRTVLERAGALEKIEALRPIEKAGGHFWWGMSPDRSWTIDFREPPEYETRRAAFHIDRGDLDKTLLDHAASLGVNVRQEAAVSAVDKPVAGLVRVEWIQEGSTHEARAPYVVDATGQSRLLSRLWGLEIKPFDGMNNFAVYGYWKGAGMPAYGPAKGRQRWTTIATCPDGWAWHIPIREDLVSVGVVTDKARLQGEDGGALEEFYRRNLRECRGIGEQLGDAELVPHPLSPRLLNVVRDWSYLSPSICGDHYFLVGDAGAFVDPVFSTGLLITSNAAMLVANALNTLWQDPATDAPLLQQSVRESYLNVAMSFHRLAAIWYTRDFRYQTLHWEAHRQRLRKGGDPHEEESARAFRNLCMGSFADPISGVLYNPARPDRFDPHRTDLHIMAEQFFEPPPDPTIPPQADVELRAQRAQQDLDHWRQLLRQQVRVTGARWSVEERYFTDAESPRWQRVRFIKAMAEHNRDPFDYVVFPTFPDLPESLFPLLNGSRLRDVLLQAMARTDPGTPQWDQRVALFHRLLSQLDLRGWLKVEGGLATIPVEWPRPLRDAFSSRDGVEITCDLLAASIAVRGGGRHGFSLIAQPSGPTSGNRPGVQLRDTKITLYGGPAQMPLLQRLATAWRAWEQTPEAGNFWEAIAPGLAGGALNHEPQG